MEVTGGNGADIVIDYSGAPICQKAAINSAAKLGKVVIFRNFPSGIRTI